MSIKKEFPGNKAGTQTGGHDVDAVNMIMDNVFDWESHEKHDGQRMEFRDYKNLVQSLKLNLSQACPDVKDDKVFDLFAELAHNGWMGSFQDLKQKTKTIIEAFLDVELGKREKLETVKRQMAGKIKFMERHYSDVGHREGVPLYTMANIMDHSDDAAKYKNAKQKSRGAEIAGQLEQSRNLDKRGLTTGNKSNRLK